MILSPGSGLWGAQFAESPKVLVFDALVLPSISPTYAMLLPGLSCSFCVVGEGGTVNVIPTMKKPAASNFLPSTAASGGLWYIPPSPDCLGTNSGQLEELGAARTKEEGPTCPPRE